MSKREAPALDGDEERGSKRRVVQPNVDHDESQRKPCSLHFPVPTMPPAVKPWRASEITATLPPLPKIFDAGLEQTVFRHPGLSTAGPSYERLEWLGDAYLELIASSLIFQTFHTTPSGKCSQLRELLICNKNLSKYFRAYGLDAKAQLPPDVHKFRGQGKSNDKDMIKIHADMFEAYVAAAIMSDAENGMQNTTSWLKTLFGRTIETQILQNEKETTREGDVQTSQLSAKDQLRADIGTKGIQLRYEDRPGPSKDKHSGLPLFTVGVYLDGWGEKDKLLGWGTALGKKEAGQKAATMALENKKLIKLYKMKKEEAQKANG